MILTQVKERLRSGPYAWPGGYPLYFICDDGAPLCFACVRKNYREIAQAHRSDPRDRQWALAAVDTNWEDPRLVCCHCNQRIESAYGEDDAEQEAGGQ